MSKKKSSELDRWWMSILSSDPGKEKKKTHEQPVQAPVLKIPPIQTAAPIRSVINGVDQNKTDVKHLRYYLGPQYPGIFLTKRELICLRHYSDGLTIKQAAEQMKVCYRTAEYLLGCVRKKTSCSRAKDLLGHKGLVKLLKSKNPKATRRRQLSVKKVEEVC